MFRNRGAAAASHVTLNSISSNPKVTFAFSNIFSLKHLFHSNKTLPLRNNNFSSIPGERSDFYDETHLSSNCSQRPQNPLDPIHHQNPSNEFYKGTSNNSVFQQNTSVGTNRVGQDRNFSNKGSWISQEPNQTPQNSTVGTYRGNSRAFDHSLVGGYSQNPSRFSDRGGGGSFGDTQQSFPIGYLTNTQIQNVPSQGRPSGLQGRQNGDYVGNVVGEFNKNGGGSANGLQTGVGDSSTLTNAKTDNGSVEGAEKSLYAGTLEELDGYCRETKVKEAVQVLEVLDKKGITVDLPRYVMLMQACGAVGVLQYAKSVHGHLIRSTGHVNVSVHNKILEMYSKCGSMTDAYEVFENMPERNLTSWDTMISGLAKNNLAEDAIDMFTKYKKAGLRPDGQMFMGVFFACSVLYDIEEGMLHFESMSREYGIVPSMEHYTSVVNMLGSAGYLDEAKEFIEKMPIEPNVKVWETLMNMCRVQGNTELGNHCADIVDFLDPFRITDKSEERLLPPEASDFAIEKDKLSNNLLRSVHEFRAGDKSPENEKIYALLRRMSAQMKEAGYVPNTRFVLHDIDQESKEEALLAHSERLAVAQALITTQARAPIRVMKNLRVCGDCHNAMKIVSQIVGRTLIMRDAKRFHHFEDGSCSCKDYW